MSALDNLPGLPEDDYGDGYHKDALSIYTLLVEMADNVSERRAKANSFFLSINSALIAIVTYVNLGEERPFAHEWLVGAAGIALSLLWFYSIQSYKKLNGAKFTIINKIEDQLPFKSFETEWQLLGEGKKPLLYIEFTTIESVIPWVFMGLHAFVIWLSLTTSVPAL